MKHPSKMYFFVLRQLSGIDKGIQCGHASLEYARQYGFGDNELPAGSSRQFADRFYEFIKYHKTFIILNGGTSPDLLMRMSELKMHGVPYAEFREPDLDDMVTAIAFIVPDYEDGEFREYLNRFNLASN